MSYIVYSAFVLCCVKIHLMVWNSVNAFRALGMRRLVTHRMHLLGGDEVFRKCDGPRLVRVAKQQLLNVMCPHAHYVHMICVHKNYIHILYGNNGSKYDT